MKDDRSKSLVKIMSLREENKRIVAVVMAFYIDLISTVWKV